MDAPTRDEQELERFVAMLVEFRQRLDRIEARLRAAAAVANALLS